MAKRSESGEIRAKEQMKADREMIQSYLNILVLQGALLTKKKMTRTAALAYFMRKFFDNNSHVLEQIDKVEEMRIGKA